MAGVVLAILLWLPGSRPWASPYPICPGVSFCPFPGGRLVLVEQAHLRPVVGTATWRDLVHRYRAVAGINGGFFNHSDGQMASFIRFRRELLGDPRRNRLLMQNPSLKPFLGKVLDRSELRIYPDGYRIRAHSEPEDGAIALLQAGPRLLPSLRLVEEAFVSYRNKKLARDPLRAFTRLPRSAVGIRPDGKLLLVTWDHASLPDAARSLRNFGCTEALALDGGSSTSFFAGKKTFGAATVHNALLVLP